MNAKLPAAKLERQIKHMIPGEVWWTVPWAIWADEDMNLWINGNYDVFDTPGGTVDTEVWLVADGRYGVRHTGNHRWRRKGSDHAWASASLPVVEFHTDDA
jgi:hypothetical protein